jgi:hypothetical protein
MRPQGSRRYPVWPLRLRPSAHGGRPTVRCPRYCPRRAGRRHAAGPGLRQVTVPSSRRSSVKPYKITRKSALRHT